MIASTAEVQAAQAFLRYVGADSHNNYLILAVVSWFHQESGSLKNVVGNNPFNIRPGVASKLSNGIRTIPRNGSFLTFATLDKGFQAAALVLQSVHGVGYELALKALKRGSAVDFLVALALSSWDAGHYGVRPGDNAADPRINHLLRNYAGFTGLTLPPDAKPKPPPPPPPKRPPFVPKYLQAPNYAAEKRYLDGFEAGRFYRAKHGHDGPPKVDN